MLAENPRGEHEPSRPPITRTGRRTYAGTAAALAFALFFSLSAPARAETLTFDAVLAKALKQSFDIRIAETDVEISTHRKDEVRSLYYPSLSVRLYNEYVKVLEDRAGEVVAVGDVVSATSRSTYQHSLAAGLSYRLYDFGARGLRMENAERDIRISRLNSGQTDLDLRKDVLDAYARGLTLSRQIAGNRDIEEKRREIFRQTRMLRDAGTVGQLQLEKAGLKFAESASRGDDLLAAMQKALDQIGYFTAETYSQEGTSFVELDEPAGGEMPEVIPDVRLLPGVRALDEEISKKEAEHAVARREMLPHLNMQSAYRWFGSNENSFTESFRALSERDATIALVMEWEFFSGFRDVAKGRRLKEEMRRLQLQKEKRLAEFRKDVTTQYETYRLYGAAQERGENRLALVKEGRATLSRLTERQIIDQVSALEREIELIEQELDASLNRIERAVAGYKLYFYQQAWSGAQKE